MAQGKTPLELTVEAGLQKITAAVTTFKQAHPDAAKLTDPNKDEFSTAIKNAIRETLDEMPKDLKVTDVYLQLSKKLHPDKFQSGSCKVFDEDTLSYLKTQTQQEEQTRNDQDNSLSKAFQQALISFKEYVPQKPPSVWENPIRYKIEIFLISVQLELSQLIVDLLKKQEAGTLSANEQGALNEFISSGIGANQARNNLKLFKKSFKEIAPALAFKRSMERGLDKYPQPLKFIINFLFSNAINFPLNIAENITLFASFITQTLSYYLLQAPINAFLNLLTGDKFNALMEAELEKEKEGLLELVLKKLKEKPEFAEFTLQDAKAFLDTPIPDDPETPEIAGAQMVQLGMNVLLNLMLSQEAQRPDRVIKVTLAAAWKSLTEKDANDSSIFFFFSCLFRLPFLVILSLLTIALQTSRLILELTTSVLTSALQAVRVASLFLLNLPRLLFKLPKYLSKAWENHDELASSFGNWLSEKAFTLSSGVLLSLAAVGVAAAVFGLNPMMLGIVAAVSSVLSLILTHDDLDVGNRGLKFGLSLMIFLGAAVMVFFAFGPMLFPEIAEFIPSLPQLLDYLLPFSEPIQAAIAAAGAVAIVLLPTIIAGTTDKAVEAFTPSNVQDEPPKPGAPGGLAYDANWKEKDAAAAKSKTPGLGDKNAYSPQPVGATKVKLDADNQSESKKVPDSPGGCFQQ